MGHSLLYWIPIPAKKAEGDSFDELEPIIDVILDRFGAVTVVALDFGMDQAASAGPRDGGYEGLRKFLMRADAVGRLRSGTLAALVIGPGADGVRSSAEAVWRSGDASSRQPQISIGIAQYEYGDTIEILTRRAERAMHYGRRRGADKAVEMSRSGHMLVSDFHRREAARAAVVDTPPVRPRPAESGAVPPAPSEIQNKEAFIARLLA